MKALKTLATILGSVSATVTVLYVIGRVTTAEKKNEDLTQRNANLRLKNKGLFDALNHALKHLPREERKHVLDEMHGIAAFEQIVKNFNK